MTDIPSIIFGNELLVGVLTILMLAGIQYQRTLRTKEYLLYHKLKCRVFKILDPIARKYGHFMITTKGKDEYVTTVEKRPVEVINEQRPKFVPNLLSGAKRRRLGNDGPYQWTHSQWATYYEKDGESWQTETYLFDNGDGTADIYCHAEKSVSDPEGHLEDKQLNGDAHGKLNEVLQYE